MTPSLGTGEPEAAMPAKTLRDVFVEAARGVRSAAACLVTLEQVVKLNIVAECPNCRRMFRDGGCTFVGCHGGSPHPVYHCKATLRVEDGSEEANLFLKGDPCPPSPGRSL